MKNKKYLPGRDVMIAMAEKDTDAATCFVAGENWETAGGCIIVVKGREEAFKARNLLANAGLLTPWKPVKSL